MRINSKKGVNTIPKSERINKIRAKADKTQDSVKNIINGEFIETEKLNELYSKLNIESIFRFNFEEVFDDKMNIKYKNIFKQGEGFIQRLLIKLSNGENKPEDVVNFLNELKKQNKVFINKGVAFFREIVFTFDKRKKIVDLYDGKHIEENKENNEEPNVRKELIKTLEENLKGYNELLKSKFVYPFKKTRLYDIVVMNLKKAKSLGIRDNKLPFNFKDLNKMNNKSLKSFYNNYLTNLKKNYSEFYFQEIYKLFYSYETEEIDRRLLKYIGTTLSELIDLYHEMLYKNFETNKKSLDDGIYTQYNLDQLLEYSKRVGERINSFDLENEGVDEKYLEQVREKIKENDENMNELLNLAIPIIVDFWTGTQNKKEDIGEISGNKELDSIMNEFKNSDEIKKLTTDEEVENFKLKLTTKLREELKKNGTAHLNTNYSASGILGDAFDQSFKNSDSTLSLPYKTYTSISTKTTVNGPEVEINIKGEKEIINMDNLEKEKFYDDILEEFTISQKDLLQDYKEYAKRLFEDAKKEAKEYFDDKETIKLKIRETLGLKVSRKDRKKLEEFHGIIEPYFLYSGQVAIIGGRGAREEFKLEEYKKMTK